MSGFRDRLRQLKWHRFRLATGSAASQYTAMQIDILAVETILQKMARYPNSF
jgi:hypothetical protein